MEKAAKECQPAERPAMLRRWLTALRGLQSGEVTDAAGAADAVAAAASTAAAATSSDAVDGTSPPAPAATDSGGAGDQDWDSLNLAAGRALHGGPFPATRRCLFSST